MKVNMDKKASTIIDVVTAILFRMVIFQPTPENMKKNALHCIARNPRVHLYHVYMNGWRTVKYEWNSNL